MTKNRYLTSNIIQDLKEKMVFIGGPRQVGKTTLAKHLGETTFSRPLYWNWDYFADRRQIIKNDLPAGHDLLIFDEIHKYPKWKSYLKGIYDKYSDNFKIMVTGSARLDTYRRGGDSLLGRYHYYRLHPFSLNELLTDGKVGTIQPFTDLNFSENKMAAAILKQLFTFGGFPEPYLKKDQTTLRRFHNERLERLVQEDIRDLSRIQDLTTIQLLTELLPSKVGSLLSINSLQEDLLVSHKTISSWLTTLEKMYYHFSLKPFNASTIKSLRKQAKIYLWDWSPISDAGVKFENLIASHLLKLTHFLIDSLGFKAELFYLRDIEGRETDFLLAVDKKPWLLLEAKYAETKISPHLSYFKNKLKAKYVFQVVYQSNMDLYKDGIRLISADKFLTGLI